MSDTSSNPNGPDQSGYRVMSRRTFVVWIVIFFGIIALMLIKDHIQSNAEGLSQYRFETLVDQGMIAHAVIKYSNQGSLTRVVGSYYKIQGDQKTEIPFQTSVRLTYDLERKLLTLPQVEPGELNTLWTSIFFSLLPFLIVGAAIWFFFIRQIKKASIIKNPGNPASVAVYVGQQDRFDKLLDKWEEQAERMDGVLDQLERGGRN